MPRVLLQQAARAGFLVAALTPGVAVASAGASADGSVDAETALEPTSSPAPPSRFQGEEPEAEAEPKTKRRRPKFVPTSDATEPPVDTGRARRRAAAGATLMVIGSGAAAASAVFGYRALTPTCADPNVAMTCEIPSGADIRRRGTLVTSAGVLSLGGAVITSVGARVLLRGLRTHDPIKTKRRRAIATAAGATSLVAGIAGLATGTALVYTGYQKAAGGELPPIDETDPTGSVAALSDDADQRLEGVKVARTGVAVALVSPTLVFTGISLIANRAPKTRVAPAVGPDSAGVVVSGRF